MLKIKAQIRLRRSAVWSALYYSHLSILLHANVFFFILASHCSWAGWLESCKIANSVFLARRPTLRLEIRKKICHRLTQYDARKYWYPIFWFVILHCSIVSELLKIIIILDRPEFVSATHTVNNKCTLTANLVAAELPFSWWNLSITLKVMFYSL